MNIKEVKNKLGFTMVELLGAIVIIGILATIGIVSVTKVLNKSHDKFNQSQGKILTQAGQNYFSDNKRNLPTVVGEKKTILLTDLVKNNYIDKIYGYDKKPFNLESSFVTVTKLKNGKYKYEYRLCYDEEGKQCVGNGNNIVNKTNNSKIEFIKYDKFNSKDDNTFYTNNYVEVTVGITNNVKKITGYKYEIQKNNNQVKTSEIINVNETNYLEKVISLSKNDYKDGQYKIRVTSYDTDGASKTVTSGKIIWLDTVTPTCSISVTKGKLGENGWYKRDPSTGSNQKIRLALNEKDNSSGILKTDFSTAESSNYNNQNIVEQGDTGGTKWYGKVIDKAGNTNTCSATYKVDTLVPYIANFSISSDNSSYKTITPNVSVAIADANKTRFSIDTNVVNKEYVNLPFEYNLPSGSTQMIFKSFSGLSSSYNRIDNFCNKNLASPGYNGANYTLQLTVKDEAGNDNSTSKNYKVYQTCTTTTKQSESWSSCSALCYRDVNNKPTQTSNYKIIDKYTNTLCSSGTDTQVCNNNDCCSSVSGGWTGETLNVSSCSVSCGGGLYTWQSHYKTTSNYDSGICEDKWVNNSAGCNPQSCCSSTYNEYDDEGWEEGECSKECGGGTRTDTIYYDTISNYNGELCTEDNVQTATSSCNTDSCDSKSCKGWSGCSCDLDTAKCKKKRTCTITSGGKTKTETESKKCTLSHTHVWKARGNKKRNAGFSWTCTHGHSQTEYYQIYCSKCGKKKTSSPKWVCSKSPYGKSDGWKVIDDGSR